MTLTHDIPGPRTAEPGYVSYAVHDGTVTAYAAGSFIEVRSGDGRLGRYALAASTRIDAARLTTEPAPLALGQTVNLTARLDGDEPTATVIRLGPR